MAQKDQNCWSISSWLLGSANKTILLGRAGGPARFIGRGVGHIFYRPIESLVGWESVEGYPTVVLSRDRLGKL
jgi:hypothetical protein